LAVGAALLSAPAAFAQIDSAPGDQPAQVAPDDAQAAPAPPPDQALPPDQGAAPAGAYQSPDQGPAYAPPNQPAPGYYTGPQGQGPGSRLYVQQGDQGVQIISNAPIRDTLITRRQFPPLSRGGRRTAPAGN
jgi:hypothetical protein